MKISMVFSVLVALFITACHQSKTDVSEDEGVDSSLQALVDTAGNVQMLFYFHHLYHPKPR